jgi:hypothetical protein
MSAGIAKAVAVVMMPTEKVVKIVAKRIVAFVSLSYFLDVVCYSELSLGMKRGRLATGNRITRFVEGSKTLECVSRKE